MHRTRVKGKGHVGVAVLQLVRPVLLGHHAAADAYQQTGIFLPEMLAGADDGQGLFLRVFPDGAGVHQNKIRFFHGFHPPVAHGDAESSQPFTVRFVLLAAEGQDIVTGGIFSHFSLRRKTESDPVRCRQLAFDFVRGEKSAGFGFVVFFHMYIVFL